jgi:hypothetical protein
MLINVKELFDYKIAATDGEIGSVDDVLFDESSWMVRYVVVDTGGWLFGRKVLVAPVALQQPDFEGKRLPVELTKDQVKDSPDIMADPPLSRQRETEYHDYFRWPYYWGGGGVLGGTAIGVDPAAVHVGYADVQPEDPNLPKPTDRDRSLRSARSILGDDLLSGDDKLGEVGDLIIDTSAWNLPLLVAGLEDEGSDTTKVVLLPTAIVKDAGLPD